MEDPDPLIDHRGSFTRIDVGFDDLAPLPERTDIAATDAKVPRRDFGSFPDFGSEVPNGSTRTVTVSPPRSSHTADADVVTRAMYTVSTSVNIVSWSVPGTTDPAGSRQNTPSRNRANASTPVP